MNFDGAIGSISNMHSSILGNHNKKGGLNELAKALGTTPQELQSMSKADVEKLAEEKGVNLDDYQKPSEQNQIAAQNQAMTMNGSIFRIRPELG